MPRKRNALAVAAGKLILAIKEQEGEVVGESDAASTRTVMNRAHTLQHAAHNECVTALLNGRTVVEYLDMAWVELHPAVRPSIDAFVSEYEEAAI